MGVLDLTSFTAYTLEQCVDACSQYNFRDKNATCQAVVINDDVAFLRGRGNGANCWLKSNTESFWGKGFTTAKLEEGEWEGVVSEGMRVCSRDKY
jgi:hypothetical protein